MEVVYFLKKRLVMYCSTGKIFITNLLGTALPCSLNRIPRKARGNTLISITVTFALILWLPFYHSQMLEEAVHRSEAVARRFSVKNVFLKISQNL